MIQFVKFLLDGYIAVFSQNGREFRLNKKDLKIRIGNLKHLSCDYSVENGVLAEMNSLERERLRTNTKSFKNN